MRAGKRSSRPTAALLRRPTAIHTTSKRLRFNIRSQPTSQPGSGVPEHQPVAGETLMPLRGAAARIAENMNASLSIPLATSQRVMPVKVIDENRRILNEHRTLVGKGKISYTHIVGLGHREGSADQSFVESRVRGNQRTAVPRGARQREYRYRGGCGGQGRRAILEGAQHQGHRVDGFRPVRGRFRRHHRAGARQQADRPGF